MRQVLFIVIFWIYNMCYAWIHTEYVPIYTFLKSVVVQLQYKTANYRQFFADDNSPTIKDTTELMYLSCLKLKQN